jgi:lipoate-protein ligase A
MLFLEHAYLAPESNLALDEALLENAEIGSMGEILRIWESPVYFVVLGYSSKWKNEVYHSLCKKNNVSILRRKSGGATVLQGPGCLNFSLILEAKQNSGIRSDTQRVMQEHQKAAQSWQLPGVIEIRGISDLTWQERKFSGNAMRRGKKYFLFHGTFLYQFDLSKIACFLASPDREPTYRAKRSHLDFLTNIPVQKNLIINSLRKAWGATSTLRQLPEIEQIKTGVYTQSDWNYKY